ncbi:MAG: DUF3108 domain-containing protein [Candidatus Saccharibacteria bacterium]
MKKKKPARKKKPKRKQKAPIRGLAVYLWAALLLITVRVTGQQKEFAFKSGETALYGAYYNWHFIWLQSGEVYFKADTLQYDHQKAWHLKAVGKTFKAYDLVYSVRDTFEVFCQYDSFLPLYSRRAINHAGHHSVHRYLFNYSTKKIALKVDYDRQPSWLASIPVMENTYDLLATAYHFRSFDFNKLAVGQKVPYRMLLDRKVEDLYFRYLGKENVKTRTGKVYRCQKVSVFLLQGDFFPQGEYMKIWFTDDRNCLPVQVETEIQVGSVKALLIEPKSLKYPLTSLIK